jgi:hypothetical protein
MYKTENLKIGDTIFSLYKDEIKEWEIVAVNPRDSNVFILVDKENGNIRSVHWKTLEYGNSEMDFFSLSKDELIERYKRRTSFIIDKISKSL